MEEGVPKADEFGVSIYDFRVVEDIVPCFEWCSILESLRTKEMQVRKCEPPPRDKKKHVIIRQREINIYGELVEQGVEKIGSEWLEFIPKSVHLNINELSPSSSKLNYIQDWALTMILFDYPGAIYCGGGYSIREAFFIGIACRVTTISNSLHTSVYHDFNHGDKLGNILKECDSLPVRRPISILFCHSDRSAAIATESFKWLLKKTDVFWEHVTTFKINEPTKGNIRKFGELLIGTPATIRDYLIKHAILLDRLESIFILSADVYIQGSDKEKVLQEALEYIKNNVRRKFSIYLYFRKITEITPFLESLLPAKYSVINVPKKENYHPPAVKICLCNQEEIQISFMRKLSYLYAIVMKIYQIDDRKINKATLIVCRDAETIKFISTYFNFKLGIVFPIIIDGMDTIQIERARNLFRSRATDFLVIDYPSVGLLESGNIATTILFDMPTIRRFEQKMFTLSDLSAKIQQQSSRQLFLLIDPEVDSKIIGPIHKFLKKLGGISSQTFEAIYQSLVESELLNL